MKPLTALIILDGFGYSKSVEGNAIREAGNPLHMLSKGQLSPYYNYGLGPSGGAS